MAELIKLEFPELVLYIQFVDDQLTMFQPALGGYYSEQISETRLMELAESAQSVTKVQI